MSTTDTFIFKDYSFDPNNKILNLNYAYSNGLEFNEKYTFDFEFSEYDQAQLDRAFEYLFLIAGVSYFKAYAPMNVEINKDNLTKGEAEFYSKTYQKGLGEFWYVNKLDPRRKVNFKASAEYREPISTGPHNGMLVGIGGGKDSLVVVEALKAEGQEFMTWSLNHRTLLSPLINQLGTSHAFIDRDIDPKIIELNKTDIYNGHIPISAIIAAVGTVVAILSGRRDIVVGNESSANEATLQYQGVDINHQYSKSQEFEQDYQAFLKTAFGDSIRYYSFIRPMGELYVGEVFAKIGFTKYKNVFTSCNRAARLDADPTYWCGICPKCAFIFLILTPFVPRSELESLWKGKNLLLDPSLKDTYNQLLGISGDKPLECVGEIKESRQAMHMAFKIYPELQKEYIFDLPDDYNYRTLVSSEMPSDIQPIFDKFIANFHSDEQPE